MKFNPKELQEQWFLEKVKETKLKIKHHFSVPKDKKLTSESLGNAIAASPGLVKAVLLDTINGVEVWYKPGRLDFTSALEIDADGSPHAYNPSNTGLDYNANAKDKHGKWVGIACDSRGNPYIQDDNDPAPGFYVSQTSYVNKKIHPSSPDRYLNSEEIPFTVLPPHIIKAVPEIVLGSKFQATNLEHDNKLIIGLVGDVGPDGKIGEGSISKALALGINPDPKRGGTKSKVIKTTVFLGVQWQEQYPLQKYGS